MNKTLYFVRHCQATGQEAEAPLTEAGKVHAIALMGLLQDAGIGRIISSPFVRAYESISPLSKQIGVPIEIDDRLEERVLSSISLENWQQKLAETFDDFNLCFPGGESNQKAMNRGKAVIDEVLQSPEHTVALVTHGILMTLMLKHFDTTLGFLDWENMFIPDVYRVSVLNDGVHLERLQPLSSLRIQ